MGMLRSLTCTKLTLFTVSAVMIQIVGLSLFIMGFFPVKPSLSGMSGLESFYPPDSQPTELHQDISSLPPEKIKSLYQELSGVRPLYDRLVLMVIDGLPAEFVLGKHGKPPHKHFVEAMPYTQSLLARGLAIGYHAKAAPPTVTMPRLKAMVSGAIGGFLDVATNFNTQAFLDDNLIAQFLRIGWKMVMLGDDTWLKLFPNMFTRHDGVSSFFVKDTVQVDYNVSRHLSFELSRTDWDLLILHYLGLDHAGHIGGRNSILMCPKLSEMDDVVRRIHSSITLTQGLSERGTLFVIVSDHGMTESGNHGGSSYEETDSLALFISARDFGGVEHHGVNQIDIASTLALLFGVPIPKNNVGTVMSEMFKSLEDEQYLKVLEMNSWQLLRLLNTHLPELGCRKFSCQLGESKVEDVERFCCSYLDATALHESWKSQNFSRSFNEDGYRSIVLAYNEFLRSTSKWLSSKSTDKSIGFLVLGIAAMLISCLGFTCLLFQLNREIDTGNNSSRKWKPEEIFTLAVIFLLVLSMGSSSMVEEEHYIWHFMTSSFYILSLRKTILSMKHGTLLTSILEKRRNFHRIYCVITILISGRILRGWHQGGVNWSYLPDISKLLERAGPVYTNYLQVLSLSLVVIVLCLALTSSFQFKTSTVMALITIYFFPATMILTQVLKIEGSSYILSSMGTTTVIQIIYTLLGASSAGILVFTPWLMPINNPKTFACDSKRSNNVSSESRSKFALTGFRDSIRLIGWCYVSSWCLLQLLLQQPVNAMPISLLLVQILASVVYFSDDSLHVKQWVKVAALYYMGMAGHFSLGNTNNLATIDVAGAFIGISSHSTVISGILMFMITYASPIMYLLSTMICVSSDKAMTSTCNVDFGSLIKEIIGYPCLVPLALNSVLLLAYTIVLLLMRNHLFVWSVFSPKYLYVCATTACVYIGVLIVATTITYTHMVFATRRRLKTLLRSLT